jgi:hypothetical protein
MDLEKAQDEILNKNTRFSQIERIDLNDEKQINNESENYDNIE